MIGGPCGGQPGALPRGGKAYGKGGFPSKRKMPLKGLRKGGYISVTYREKQMPGMIEEKVEYEGKIIDKRVGWDNRESYVELENCIRLNADGEIVAKEGTKRLFDAFIEASEEIEQVERPLCEELRAAAGLGKKPEATGVNMMEAMLPAMMAVASGGMMPGMAMGAMPMGMMPTAMGMGMPMGMMGMPMMGMVPMTGMQPMGMMPMMGMPSPMMPAMGGAMPSAQMGAGCGAMMGPCQGGCMPIPSTMPFGVEGSVATGMTAPSMQPPDTGQAMSSFNSMSAVANRPRSRSRSRG